MGGTGTPPNQNQTGSFAYEPRERVWSRGPELPASLAWCANPLEDEASSYKWFGFSHRRKHLLVSPEGQYPVHYLVLTLPSAIRGASWSAGGKLMVISGGRWQEDQGINAFDNRCFVLEGEEE